MLRDCLVCGVQDNRIQRNLLAKPDLTFREVLELAQLHESAEANTKTLSALTGQLQLAWTPVSGVPLAPLRSARRGVVEEGTMSVLVGFRM